MPETSPAPAATAPDLSMPLEEAMRTQRAIRRLKPDPIDDALVLRLIELALKAPTGSNAQNWEFVMVKDRAVKERLGALNRGAFRIYGGLGRWMARNDPRMLRIIEAMQWQADHFADIPVVIVACLRGLRVPFPSIAATSYYGSIYPSVQNLRLAARPLRTHDAPPGRRGRARRPPREPAVPTRLQRRLTPSQNIKENQAWRGPCFEPLFVGFGGSW